MSYYTVCPHCAYELEYADSSARDFHDLSGEARIRMDNNIGRIGIVALVNEIEDGPAFDCEVCEFEFILERRFVFETVEVAA